MAAGDQMSLVGPGNRGNQVSLSGVPGQRLNAQGTTSLQSLEDVISLMKEDRVCMESGNNVSATFFWNPKPVLDALDADRKKAVAACIGEIVGTQGDTQSAAPSNG